MSDLVTVEVSTAGFDEQIQQVTRKARRSLAKALRAGITVIGEEIQRHTPVDTGLLRDAAAIAVKTDPDSTHGEATFGFGDQGYIALWLEYGHKIVGHKPNLKDTGKEVLAKPFMRPAVDTKAEEAADAFGEVMRDQLKEVL